jgi:hypothetical protein
MLGAASVGGRSAGSDISGKKNLLGVESGTKKEEGGSGVDLGICFSPITGHGPLAISFALRPPS